jgi:phosphoribosylformylglycinamidine synthase
MKFRARVEVRLKLGFFDPEGEAVKEALNDLGYQVRSVRVSKVYYIDFEGPSLNSAERLAQEMCRRLLSNPTKDVYEVEVRPSD